MDLHGLAGMSLGLFTPAVAVAAWRALAACQRATPRAVMQPAAAAFPADVRQTGSQQWWKQTRLSRQGPDTPRDRLH